MTATPPLAAVPDPPAPPMSDTQVELVRALLNPTTAGEVDDEHPLVYGADGTVTFTVGDTEWTLRAPTLGQFRDLVTKAEKLREATPTKANAGIGDLAQRVQWFHAVMRMLADADGPVPKADDLPLWCANPRLEFSLTAHWMRVPSKAPGTPLPGADPDPAAR